MKKPKILVTRKWPEKVETKLSESYDVTFNNNDIALNEVILHSSSLHSLETKTRIGTLTHEQSNIDRANINSAIINLLDKYI